MNFKRNFLLISSLIGVTMLVSGCADKYAFVAYSPIKEVEDTHEDVSRLEGALFKKGNYEDTYAVNESKDNLVNIGSFSEIMSNYSGKKLIPSTGEQKLLVIPVEFPDCKIENFLDVTNEEYIRDLKNAFFGVSKNNTFVSVAEFYNRSSYGKLKLSGKVAEKVYEFPISTTSIKNSSKNDDLRYKIYGEYDNIINWYKSFNDDIDDFRVPGISGSNNVPIYLVYDYPADVSSDKFNFFWNFTFPEKFVSWSSYQSLNITKDVPDAHTFIHEVGHLLGLLDYYPTSSSKSENDPALVEPVGYIDMMDSSIGDHTALSKMMLDWTRPYQVKDSCIVKMSAFEDSGEILLLNDNWNGTVFDEYYLLEFYTPTKLNNFDATHGNDLAKLPLMPGIKLYHVDTNLGYYVRENSTYKFKVGIDEEGYDPNLTSKYRIDFIHNNTNYKIEGAEKIYNNYLYELIYNHYNEAIAAPATDEHLYHLGDTLPTFRMNGNRVANYKISIIGMNYREATLKIEKIK